MRRVRRRQLLYGAGALAASARQPARAGTTGKLVTDPKGILDLPSSFSYRILARAGDRMSDGYLVPARPDAMGVFSTRDGVVLMRNHEIVEGARQLGPYPSGVTAPPEAYDPEAFGGVTRTLLDARSLQPRSTNLALCGTLWNCAGGLSPWGWLTCEETFTPRHGYVFLCNANATKLTAPRKITGYGRFRHEAATVDPATHIAYLTEDREDAAFYRFVPERRDDPFRGRLQALRVIGQPQFDANTLADGVSLPIDWVDVPEPDPADDSVRYQAHERGAARFARLEGMWLAGNELFFSATVGGPIGRGQIFRLEHAGNTAKLSVLVQSIDTSVLDMPDNITVSPHGQLYVAEDGLDGNCLRRITPRGEVIEFARNVASVGEFAGPCFTPDGSTMFVNLQREGLTLAIRGPFQAETWSPNARGEKPTSGELPRAVGLGAGLVAIALGALAHRKATQKRPS